MGDRLGLFEMLIVFALVLGFAAYELWTLRRYDKKRPGKEKR